MGRGNQLAKKTARANLHVGPEQQRLSLARRPWSLGQVVKHEPTGRRPDHGFITLWTGVTCPVADTRWNVTIPNGMESALGPQPGSRQAGSQGPRAGVGSRGRGAPWSGPFGLPVFGCQRARVRTWLLGAIPSLALAPALDPAWLQHWGVQRSNLTLPGTQSGARPITSPPPFRAAPASQPQPFQSAPRGRRVGGNVIGVSAHVV
jgi:hypothetical protein